MQYTENQPTEQQIWAFLPPHFKGRDGHNRRKCQIGKVPRVKRYKTVEDFDKDDTVRAYVPDVVFTWESLQVAYAQLPDHLRVVSAEQSTKLNTASDSLFNNLRAEQQRAEQETNVQITVVEQDKQTEIDKRREVIDLRVNEAACDMWTFDFDHRAKEWVIDRIYQSGVLSYLEGQQFAKRYRPDGISTFLIRGETVIENASVTLMRDSVRAYIEADPHPLESGELSATYESRLEIYNRQQHLIINPTGLEGLRTHDRPLLRDTATTCYVPYENGIVEITKMGIVLQPYKILHGSCVWQSQVLRRQFNADANGEDSHIAQFIQNISNGELDRIRAKRSAIGYLIHHHGNPAEGQAIICYDEEITNASKPEGGTGKGLFGNAIRQIRPVAVIDGKKHDPNDKFNFQQVNQDTAVVWIDDPIVNHPKPERRFSLEQFFSKLTEGWSIEKKHQQEFRIPPHEGPKLLISSNVVMSNEGSSNVRRQFILEFSNHYKKQIRDGNEKPIVAEHGCVFFSEDWDAQEWQRFDRYMMGCVLEYMREGLQPCTPRSANQNHLRQTAGEDFYDWVTTHQGTGLVAGQEYSRDELLREYRTYAGLSDTQVQPRGFTNNVTQYAKSKGWKYERGRGQRNISFTLLPL